MSMESGTLSFFTPSSSAVRPQRSSDSVNTTRARAKPRSSWAICSMISVSRRLMASCSGAGTLENAAVRLTSAMEGSDAGRGGGAQVIEPGLEPALAHPDRHRPREEQRAVGLMLGDHVVAHPAERGETALSYPIVDPQLAALGMHARRLDGLLRRVARVHHVGDHLRDGRDDLPSARRAHREVWLAVPEAERRHHVDDRALAGRYRIGAAGL